MSSYNTNTTFNYLQYGFLVHLQLHTLHSTKDDNNL